MNQDKIVIKGAREHNLKNISLEIRKFNYDGENSFQIKNISLEIFKNQKIGIIPPIGGG